MPAANTRRPARHAPGRPLKSPLAVASAHRISAAPVRETAAAPPRSELPPRTMQLSEFADYLRTVNNREGRPYEESTISTYSARREGWMPG